MLRLFKKRINPIHSVRNYDSSFSSKADVLSPLTSTNRTESKSPKNFSRFTTAIKQNSYEKGPKTGNKVNIQMLVKSELGNNDDLDSSFRKHYAEFHFHKETFLFCKKSLYLFDENSKIRKAAVWLTESAFFKTITILMILINVIMLGMIDYTGKIKDDNLNVAFPYINTVFIIFYAFEVSIKILARGFASDSNCYLRTGWNCLDLFVAVSGIFFFEESLKYYSILRIGRLIRLLRPFRRFKRINYMLSILSSSFFLLVSILVLLLFFLIICSIIGLNIYSGALDFRCRLTPLPARGTWPIDPNIYRICGSGFECPANLFCGSSHDIQDSSLNRDLYFEEFNWGLTNFDNIFQSLFTVFIIINGNWEKMLVMLSDSSSNALSLFYCFSTYIVCKFFIIQLGVAVMLDAFTKIKQKENPKKIFLGGIPISRIEEGEEKNTSSNPEKKQFREKWEEFLKKYFPPVEVPADDYYKNILCFYAYKITSHKLFTYISLGLTLFNTAVIMIDRFPISQWESNFIVTTNCILTIMYVVEVVLKIIANSAQKYLEGNFNVLEFIIAIVSMVEIYTADRASAFSVLRILIFIKFMRKEYGWDTFKILIMVVFEGFLYIIDFTIILIVYIYTFSILGMKYFAGTFKFDLNGNVDLINGFTPRANFDTLSEAITVVFRVIINDDFLEIILSAIRATGWPSIIYFIALIVTGKYLLIQLFLAIILGSFEESRERVNFEHLASRFLINKVFRKKVDKKPESIGSLKDIPKNDKTLGAIIEKHQLQIKNQAEIDFNENWAKTMKKEFLDDVIENFKQQDAQDATGDSARKPLFRRQFTRIVGPDAEEEKQKDDFKNRPRLSKVYPEPRESDSLVRKITLKMANSENSWIRSKIQQMNDSSLFVFHKNGSFRKFITKMITKKIWETLVLVSIFVSSVLLMLDSPLNDPDSVESGVYDALDKVLTVFFALEMILKIISSGFIFNSEDNQKSYIRNAWNMIDCLVVVTSCTDILTGGNIGLKSLKSLRALRALRPLRVISRNENLKLIVNALFRTFPSVKNLSVVVVITIIIAATIGILLFKGKFYYCSKQYPSYFDLPMIITKDDCLSAAGQWTNNSMDNFDNFFEAMLTYFKMMIGGGWIDALYSGVDSIDINYQPKRWARPIVLAYFYIFLLVGNVLVKNLFVGVVIDNFRQMKEELGGFLLLNNMQRDWAELQVFMQRRKLKRIIPEPHNQIRKFCFRIVQKEQFEHIMMLLILINTILLGLTFEGQSNSFQQVLSILNLIFLGIFHVEAIINVIGLGIFYFKDAWNKFDLAILIVTDSVFLFTLITGNSNFLTIPTVVRSLRLGRVVKYIRASKHIRVLVDTIYYLIPSLANIGALLVLIMFIYAVLGINLFAGVKLQTHINVYANFQNLLAACNILIRCTLGQDWHLFMTELANTEIDGCQDNQSYQDIEQNGILGCGTFLAYPYFVSYNIIVTLIIINLFLAIVIGGYAESKKESEAIISPSQMDELFDKWAEYDPQGTGFITPEQFAFLIHDLPQPLGQKDNASVKYEYDVTAKKNKDYLISENKKIIIKRKLLIKDMERFNIPVYSSKVHFSDVCRVISRNAVIKAHRNETKAENTPKSVRNPPEDANIDIIEEELKEKIKYPLSFAIIYHDRIKSDYVNKTLAKGWVNRYGIIKKLQKEAKIPSLKHQSGVQVTNYYAGRLIYGFWKKWKEDKRLYELQLAEKKGVDYERTFELQQRLANVKVQKMATIKKGKPRIFDKKKSKRTQASMTSVSGVKELKSNVSPEEDAHSRQMSLLSVDAPEKSRESYCSISEEDANRNPGIKGNFEKLIEYKNSKRSPAKRRTSSAVSNFAQFRSFHNNEFWLQSVTPNEKFPVPVTIEIDRFMLSYLGQPDSMRSRSLSSSSEEMVNSEVFQSLHSPPSIRFLRKKSASSKEEESKSDLNEDKNSQRDEAFSAEKIPPEDQNKETSEHELENSPIEENYKHPEAKNNLETIIKITSEEAESKLKEKILETVRINLETIEEKHEEYNETNTRIEIESSGNLLLRPVKIEIKPTGADKIQGFSQRRINSIEEGLVVKAPIEKMPTAINIEPIRDIDEMPKDDRLKIDEGKNQLPDISSKEGDLESKN